jgi:Xaa-Pro aminopeptidase
MTRARPEQARPDAERAASSRSLLLFGDTERSAALRHEIPIAIIDALMWAELDGRTVILTSHLEAPRIAKALPEAEILDYFSFGMRELRQQGLSYDEAEREVVARVAEQLGLREALVPGDFPVGVADRLRADGITVSVDDRAISSRRRAKHGRELEGIRAAQRAAEAGMAAVEGILGRAEPGPGGRLQLDGAELQVEQVRGALREACAAHGAPCPPDVMIASVWDGFGHEPGSGPMPAGLPIQVDLFPRDEATACWADMARTFVVGDPTPEHAELIAEQQRLVRAALEDALEGVRPGVTGRELYDATCERFEAAGYRTQRTGPGDDPAEGFQFSLGHGVGLEVHEEPSLGLAGHDPLVSGDVLAIEPGLWDRRIGGVRFEDLVLVTEDGSELLTHYTYELEPRS